MSRPDRSDTRTVLVTGAAGALGRTLVARHLGAGDLVVATDLQVDHADHERLVTVAADLADDAGVDDVVATIADVGGGRLDVVVHCVGLAHRSPATTTDLAIFDRVMAVNWRAPVALTRGVHPLLVAAGGTVVVVSSMAGAMPVAGRAAYGAAKAALAQFMEAWRPELADDGVHLVVVHPSFLDSVMVDASGDGRPRSQVGRPIPVETLAEMIDAAVTEQRRWVFPDRFARLASWLWQVAPGLYHHLMRRQFSQEL